MLAEGKLILVQGVSHLWHQQAQGTGVPLVNHWQHCYGSEVPHRGRVRPFPDELHQVQRPRRGVA
eukprot:680707-Lingulodinium_polyedra.AAC.1